MQTRMQPIGNIFSKFPRVVRDLAREPEQGGAAGDRGQRGRAGQDHDRGAERPADPHGPQRGRPRHREPGGPRRGGQATAGIVRLRAYHEAGQVLIEISDDGKGIDPARIAAEALEKGLITAEKAEGHVRQGRSRAIFLPGLSTADKVTDVSGRGVGMDVVKTNLDRLGGKVEIDSEPGRGTPLPHQAAADPGHHPLADRVRAGRALRHPAGQRGGAHPHRGRPDQEAHRGGRRCRGARPARELIPIVRFADVLGQPRAYIDPGTGRTEVDRRERLADRRSRTTRSTNSRAPPARDRNPRSPQPGGPARAERDLNIVVVSAGALPVRARRRRAAPHRGNRGQAARAGPQETCREYAGSHDHGRRARGAHPGRLGAGGRGRA